ncbi:MAG: SRPBCC domain-containing protein [Gemmatimonadaceae bacterium]|nr:SRPBCC domain-containing protein [Gemmatimonadaceae bacterium]
MAETVKLVSRVVIRGKIDDVWREITKTDTPQLAFFGAQMRYRALSAGSPVQMRTPDAKFTSVVGEILEVTPPHRFSHTMKFTAHDDPYCKVTYELKEVAGGVEFTLISEDVPVGTKTAKDMTRGGDFIVNTLKQIVETGKPALGTRILYAMFGLLAFTTPAKCRSEHWPLEGKTNG